MTDGPYLSDFRAWFDPGAGIHSAREKSPQFSPILAKGEDRDCSRLAGGCGKGEDGRYAKSQKKSEYIRQTGKIHQHRLLPV